MSATLYLVGAGPGDPELISVKGMKALRRADVILYDALVCPELLAYARRSCKLINVGKRKGKREFSQEEINQLLVFYAARFTSVVRLKGGDPYVFGRGHEELEYATKRGVHVEVISGISSALAAPAAANIPLTKRGVNESFWVITGTLSSGKVSNDIRLAAQSTATVIILMGINQLEEIVSIFAEARSPLEPIAIVEHATLPSQNIITGTVSGIVQQAQETGIRTPAVIVIGKVVDEAEIVKSFVTEALHVDHVR